MPAFKQNRLKETNRKLNGMLEVKNIVGNIRRILNFTGIYRYSRESGRFLMNEGISERIYTQKMFSCHENLN